MASLTRKRRMKELKINRCRVWLSRATQHRMNSALSLSCFTGKSSCCIACPPRAWRWQWANKMKLSHDKFYLHIPSLSATSSWLKTIASPENPRLSINYWAGLSPQEHDGHPRFGVPNRLGYSRGWDWTYTASDISQTGCVVSSRLLVVADYINNASELRSSSIEARGVGNSLYDIIGSLFVLKSPDQKMRRLLK